MGAEIEQKSRGVRSAVEYYSDWICALMVVEIRRPPQTSDLLLSLVLLLFVFTFCCWSFWPFPVQWKEALEVFLDN
jgi:hypothetical protein